VAAWLNSGQLAAKTAGGSSLNKGIEGVNHQYSNITPLTPPAATHAARTALTAH